MDSNLYTKDAILKALSEKGCFIDAYTLDTFLQKWNIDAIFEDEQGQEFFDANVIKIILKNLFNDSNSTENRLENTNTAKSAAQKEMELSSTMSYDDLEDISLQKQKSDQTFDKQQNNTLNNFNAQTQQAYNIPANMVNPAMANQIMPNMQNIPNNFTNNMPYNMPNIMNPNMAPNVYNIQPNMYNMPPAYNTPQMAPQATAMPVPAQPAEKENIKKKSILAGALEITGQKSLAQKLESAVEENIADINEVTQAPVENNEESEDFDDMNLLSESFEAQEKLKEYVLSEMAKKNIEIPPPQSNEFKLDISEKTINMIARTLAKKVVKHVNALLSQDVVGSDKLKAMKEQNIKLEKKARDLEEQNKKLRLLLAESNKNLNSYKPSIFGLYKKVKPKQ